MAGIIILNIVIGFMQEYSAEKTMDSLRSLSSPTSSVIRNGEGMVVPTIEVVPGDMVELKTGGELRVFKRLGIIKLTHIQIRFRRIYGMQPPTSFGAYKFALLEEELAANRSAFLGCSRCRILRPTRLCSLVNRCRLRRSRVRLSMKTQGLVIGSMSPTLRPP